MHSLLLPLLLLLRITALSRAGDGEADLDTSCPLNMAVFKNHFFNTYKEKAEEETGRFDEALKKFREESRQQTIQISAILQKVEQKFGKLDARMDSMEQQWDTQITNLHKDVKKAHSEILSGQKRESQIADIQQKFDKIADPILSKIETKFAEVDYKISGYEREQRNFSGDVIDKIELMLTTIKNLKNGMKEDMFKCGRALKLELIVVPSGTYFFSPNISNWHQAKEFCEENDMQLAIIEDENQLRQVDLAAPNHNAWYWVSGSDSDLNPGKFHWSDGTEVDDALWDKGQPSSFGPGYQTCVFLYTEDAKLGDYRCTNKEFFICQLGPECFHRN